MRAYQADSPPWSVGTVKALGRQCLEDFFDDDVFRVGRRVVTDEAVSVDAEHGSVLHEDEAVGILDVSSGYASGTSHATANPRSPICASLPAEQNRHAGTPRRIFDRDTAFFMGIGQVVSRATISNDLWRSPLSLVRDAS